MSQEKTVGDKKLKILRFDEVRDQLEHLERDIVVVTKRLKVKLAQEHKVLKGN